MKLKVEFKKLDNSNKTEKEHVIDLINQYRSDPMGANSPFTKFDLQELIKLFNTSKNNITYIGYNDDKPICIAVCFSSFSTFNTSNLLNIHDFFVDYNYRGKGVGKKLLQYVKSESIKSGFKSISLEVREDNLIARQLYSHEGFNECEPKMHFLKCSLD